METTVRVNGKDSGAYETLELSEDGIVAWGSHFWGVHVFKSDVLNMAGLLGLEYVDDMNRHDSDYIYFEAYGDGDVSEIYPKFLEYMRNLPWAVDWKTSARNPRWHYIIRMLAHRSLKGV